VAAAAPLEGPAAVTDVVESGSAGVEENPDDIVDDSPLDILGPDFPLHEYTRMPSGKH
jgi:hypothetical protein